MHLLGIFSSFCIGRLRAQKWAKVMPIQLCQKWACVWPLKQGSPINCALFSSGLRDRRAGTHACVTHLTQMEGQRVHTGVHSSTHAKLSCVCICAHTGATPHVAQLPCPLPQSLGTAALKDCLVGKIHQILGEISGF